MLRLVKIPLRVQEWITDMICLMHYLSVCTACQTDSLTRCLTACLPICLCLRMFEDLIEAFGGLEPQVSPGVVACRRGRCLEDDEGAESSLSVGQFVLCHWSDGLYYLGKIQRVTHTHTRLGVNVFALIGWCKYLCSDWWTGQPPQAELLRHVWGQL